MKSLKIFGVIRSIKNIFSRPSKIVFKYPVISNAKYPLSIPTYDGSGQVNHPSVIDFLNEYGIDEWSGYRYWMVLTPYPYSRDHFENPSLYASHDGLTWVVPQNITNPLDTAPGGWDKGFLNDPDMIYNPDTDQLWVYYRFANHDILRMQLIQINPDLSMTKPVIIMEQPDWRQSDNRTRSFCIFRECSDRWHMWGCGGEVRPPYNTYYFQSNDGIIWGDPRPVINQNGLEPFQALGLSNWHMSGKPNKNERRVEFLVYSTINNPLQRHLSKSKNPIVYMECSFDSPTLFNTPVGSPVLLSSKSGWDSGHLYRCSFQIIDDGCRYIYKIWYSATGSDGQWHIGQAEGSIGTSYRKTK
jgi:hypothetical protein